jgi:FMN-dependent NADH-azoreductase
MAPVILRIDASARKTGSVSRDLTDKVVARLTSAEVITRDLSENIPHINSGWIDANFTPPSDRTAAQVAALEVSDMLIKEVVAADTIVIGLPIYNFGVPAALKAWIDQIARAGVTFRYTSDGPQGLLKGKRAIVVVASGGTQVGSDVDFATGFLRHVLGFIGITEVDLIHADRMMIDPDASLKTAQDQLDAIAA